MVSNSRQKSVSSGSNRPSRPDRSALRGGTSTRSRSSRMGSASSGAERMHSAKTERRRASGDQRRGASVSSSRHNDVTMRSVRIGDMDRLERTQRARNRVNQSKGPLKIIAIVVAVVLVLLLVFAVLSRTALFKIENIDVEGADHLTASEVSQLVSVPQGTTLLSVDEDAIKKSLERDSWVQSVSVQRSFPSTLKIVITEREIAAVVQIAMGATQTIQNWAISADGMWLMAIPSQDSEIGQSISPRIYEDAQNVLWITDVPYGVTPEIGSYCTDENINNARDIVNGMTTELAGQVKTVSATDAQSTLLTLDNGIEIAFGEAKDIREKERLCLQIIEQNPNVVYINVRVISRPTWRAV